MKKILPWLFLMLSYPLPGAWAANPTLDTLLTKIDRLHRQPRSLGRDTTLVLAGSLLTERVSRVAAYGWRKKTCSKAATTSSCYHC